MMFMTFAKSGFASFESNSHRWAVTDPAPVGFHCEALATRQAIAWEGEVGEDKHIDSSVT